MDYPSFNSQNAPFGGQFPTAQPTPSPQHFQQSNPPFAYGQFPNGNGQAASFPGMGGALGASSVMQPGGLHQARAAALHQQQQQQQSPYAHQTLPSPAHQQFAQNRAAASPASTNGPQYVTPQSQHQQQPSASAPLLSNGLQQPMNLQLPVKAEATQAHAQLHTPTKAVPPSPVSPVTQARSQDRMATLLEINSILIKEVCDLQAQGKAGQVGPSPDGKSEGDKPQPSKEYVDYMRRLQANLAYLAQNAEKNHKPGQQIQPGPAIMSPPTAPPELVKLYHKLQELFPGWKGQTAQVKQSPGPQRINSNTSQPPNSAGLQQNWPQNTQQAQQPKAES